VNLGENWKVGGGKIERRELSQRDPTDGDVFVRMGRGAAGGEPGDEGDHRDHNGAVVVVETRERAEDFNGDAELLADFAGEGSLGGFPGFDLAAGKLPLEREVLVRGALRDEHAAGTVLNDGADDRDGEVSHGATESTERPEAPRLSAMQLKFCGATFRTGRGFMDMKTFLKVLLIALLAVAVIKLFPIFLIPVALAGVALLIGSLLLAGGAGLAVLIALGLVVALLAVALALAAVLAPIWLPLLAILGLIALGKRAGRPAATPQG